jgi:hypothetical protein
MRIKKVEFFMYHNVGEKPGKGTYQCVHSGNTVILHDENDSLPPCSSNDCTDEYPDTKWRKVF